MKKEKVMSPSSKNYWAGLPYKPELPALVTNITIHIKNIFKYGELAEKATLRLI